MSVVLITGGSRGIGRAMVEAFGAAGYSVAFTYHLNEAAARELAPALAFEADVRDRTRAKEVFSQVEKAAGPVDVLINNAGVKFDGAFHRMSAEDWNTVIDTNLNGVFHYSQLAVQSMLRRGGVILNITSVSGLLGIAGQANYGASKAAVVGLTKALAKEVARFEIRVNAIAPGFVQTDMTDAMPEAAREKAFAQIPMRKPGDPAQVAQLALYLASPHASYITGQVFAIDGGLS